MRIKELLKEKKMTAKELADIIKLTPTSVSNLINEKSKPSIEVFENIAKALDVPITELFEPVATDEIRCPVCGTSFKMEKPVSNE